MSHFDSVANEWDNDNKIQFFESLSKEILNKKPSLSSDTLRVMDFGCGTGLFGLNFFEGKNSTILGIDTSQEMLNVFEKKVSEKEGASTLNINLEENELPAGKAPFDLIVSAMAFHHLNNPEAMLKRLKGYLAPQGTIVVVDLDEEDGSFHPDNKGMGVKHFGFSKEKLSSWADDNDMKINHSIFRKISKNDREYGQFLALFEA